jgi:hypothetical protein
MHCSGPRLAGRGGGRWFESTGQPALRPELQRFQAALEKLKASGGILVAKGLANVATVPGLMIDTLFLFSAKNDVVARDLAVDRDSLVGLFLPAGADRHHPQATLSLVPWLSSLWDSFVRSERR